MELKDKKLSLLAYFSLNENKISLLYSAYAAKFPESADFWKNLAEDEKRHSALLLGLDQRYGAEINQWKISNNAPAILDYVSKFIDDCLKEIEKKEFSLKEAFNNAISLEQSMIEKKNFEIFSTINEDVKTVLEKLNRETEGHRLRLLKFAEKNL